MARYGTILKNYKAFYYYVRVQIHRRRVEKQNWETVDGLIHAHPLFVYSTTRALHEGAIYLVEALDFETRRAYELVVRASDNGRPRALSSSALVRVLVEDANDEPPVIELVDLSTSASGAGSEASNPSVQRASFGASRNSVGVGGRGVLWAQDTRRLEIFENEPAGTWLAGVLVTDADAEAPQSLHCRLDARLSPHAFDLRPIEQQSQSQSLPETSSGGDQSSRRADRRPPIGRRKRSVNERKPSQSQSRSGSGSGNEQQHQRRRLYALVTNASFDRERDSLFADTIRCSDRGAPALESELAFSVLVRDRNDNPPRFREPLMRLSVRENNAPDELIGQLLALDSDADAGAETDSQQQPRTHYFLEPVPEQLNTSVAIALINQNFNFSVYQSSPASGSGALGGQGDVRVERDTGRLVAAALLDRERRSEYRFFAVARDAAAPALSSRALLVVEVLDENDNSVHWTQICI